MNFLIKSSRKIIKIKESDTEKLEKSLNPFAVIVLAHLKAQETSRNKKKAELKNFQL